MLPKEHEINVLGDLLEKYANTEALSGGSIEARILAFYEKNKDNLDEVSSMALDHVRTQSKNKFVMVLLDYVEASDWSSWTLTASRVRYYGAVLLSRTRCWRLMMS